MINKEKAWELSKLLAKYADDEESYFAYNRSGLEEAGFQKTGIFPHMNSNLSQWRVSKPRKLDWMKVPVDTRVVVWMYEEAKFERSFTLYIPTRDESKFLTFNPRCSQSNATSISYWEYCEIHPDVKIQEEWYEDETYL